MNNACSTPGIRKCDSGIRCEQGIWRGSAGLLLVVMLLMVSAGCEREGIQVYRVAKDTAQPTATEQTGAEPQSAMPRLQWTTPKGWEEHAGSAMRVASFNITGKSGQSAEVSVIPLPTVAGHELDLVNMWRGQVQLPAATQEEIALQGEGVAIGENPKGKLFDMVSPQPVGERKTLLRLLVATVDQQGTSWFFKMTGDDSLVQEQKPTMVEFLKSVKFAAEAEPMQFAKASRAVSTNTKQLPHENADKPAWVVPPGWQEVNAGQMLAAKFVIAGSDGAKAELNVSQLGGTGGGLLPNVNRWRNQLGLPPTTEGELNAQLQSLDVEGGKAILVEMAGTDAKTGQKAKLIGAIVPQSGQTWFYKLLGNEKVVEQQREIFTGFLKTIKYANVP